MEKIIPIVTEHLLSGRHWTVEKSFYRGKYHTFDILEELTKPLNAQGLSDNYNENKPKEKHYPANSLIMGSIMDSAVISKNSSLINFLGDTIRKKFPNTLSEMVYFLNENGKAVHNFGTPDEFWLYGKNLVGQDDFIQNLNNIEDILRILIGRNNIFKLNEISQAMNKTQMWLRRVNEKPNMVDKKLVGFNAYSNELALYCDRNLSRSYPAFRVLQVD
jgi:hypothetical protein